jgi:hypothetical protein
MEILLQQALERKEGFVDLIVKMIRNFKSFYDIVVHCARKSEITVWPDLFKLVGDPKDLFQACLESQRLETAASYLIVLQTMEPFEVFGKLQITLLEYTLLDEKFELTAQIVRYLKNVNQPYVGSNVLSISIEEEQSFYIDVLISRYLRTAMENFRISLFYRLASALEFPATEWLKKERGRLKITNLGNAFKIFKKEYPNPFMRESEIRWIMIAAEEAKCWSLTLLLATLIQEGAVVLKALDETKQYDSYMVCIIVFDDRQC